MKIRTPPHEPAKHPVFQRSCSILAAAWLLLHTSPALTQSSRNLVQLDLPELAVTLVHPDIFEKTEKPNALRAVLLRSKESGALPSISILAVPGRYDFDRPLKQLAQEIVHSYKLVGFTDARCLKLAVDKSRGTAVAQAEMAYTQDGRGYASRVAIFSGGQRHFLITLSDHAETFKNNQELLGPVIDSFQAADLLKTEAGPAASITWPYAEGLLTLLGLACLVTTLLFLGKRRDANRSQTKPSEKK